MDNEFEEALRLLEELEAREGVFEPPVLTSETYEFEQEPDKEEGSITLDSEKTTNRERWVELLESIHPDAWDFVDIPSISSNTLVIKFPHIVIKNKEKNSHVIRDLSVFWGLTDDYKPHCSLSGWRGIRTWNEFTNRYSHSHLGSGSVGSLNNTFCLGSNDFSILMGSLNSTNDCNWDDIQKALLMLHLYVEWESISGTPYIRFDKVYNNYSYVEPEDISKEEYETLFKSLIVKMAKEDVSPISTTSVNGIVTLICNEDIIKPYLISQLREMTGRDHLTVINSQGRLTSLEVALSSKLRPTEAQIRDAEIALLGNKDNENSFVFKGERVIPKIIVPKEESLDIKEENLNIVPNQIISDKIYSMLEEQINKYAIDSQYEFESM